MKNKNLLLISAAVAVIIVVVLITVYVMKSKEKADIQSVQEQTTKEIFSDLMLSANLFGEIKSIAPDKKSIVVEVPSVLSISVPEAYRLKTVAITEETKIISKTSKTQEQFSKELADARAQSEGVFFVPPPPFNEKELTIDDLNVGDKISFTFSPEEEVNILVSQFIANQISVNY